MVNLRRNLNRPLTWDEMDDNFARLDVKGSSIKFFDTLQEALDLQPRPENGIAFQVRKETDPENFGFYVFDNREAVGYRYLGERWSDEYLNEIEGQIEDFKQDINQRVDEVEDIVVGIGSGEGGKAYDSLADALAADIPDNVIFQTPEGVWRRDSTLPEGAEFLRGLPVSEEDFQDFEVEVKGDIEDFRNDITPRILPKGQEFEIIDRPDLNLGVVEVDEELNIFKKVNETQFEIIKGFDRPDLNIAVVDSDNNIIFTDSKFDEEASVMEAHEYIKRFYEPKEQTSFDIYQDHPWLLDYNLLIEKWDGIMTDNPTNPNLQPYITKTSIGTSTQGKEIYRYNFIPPRPKHKVLLISGSHANEKMYIKIWYEFFKTLVEEWTTDPVLEWLRWNVEFAVLPCRCPDTLGGPRIEYGSRIAPETEPFPINWTRSGEEVTITFDVADFPSDGFLTGENYFSSVDKSSLEGKVGVAIITTSDNNALPEDAYIIKTVISGNSIVIENPTASGATSGTGTLQVWTDPNRNFAVKGYNTWEVFTNHGGKSYFEDNKAKGFGDDKGTQPYSLKESRVLVDILNENFDFVIDAHAPARDHYWEWDARAAPADIQKAANNVKYYSGSFVMSGFEQLGETSQALPYPSAYHATFNNKNFYTVEWGSGLREATASQVKDAFRWIIAVLTEALKIKH